MEEIFKYPAKISIRTGKNYCVKVPSEIIENENLKVGDKVKVEIKKIQPLDLSLEKIKDLTNNKIVELSK